jgi:hypothetical protein
MSPDVSGLQIQNPAVKTFKVHLGFANYDQIFRAFPGIQKLDFSALRDKQYGLSEIKNDSLNAMSRLKELKELQLGQICQDMIPKIKCYLLEKLTIDCNYYYLGGLNEEWRNFIERHPNIQWFEMNGTNSWGADRSYIKCLASLRTLKIRNLLEPIDEPVF